LAIAIYVLAPKGNVKGINAIDSDGLRALVSQGNLQMIDVRTPEEYRSNHVKGFKNIPLQQLNTQLNTLDTSKPIVVICASGARSGQASQLLSKNGFSSIYNFSGGINAYRK